MNYKLINEVQGALTLFFEGQDLGIFSLDNVKCAQSVSGNKFTAKVNIRVAQGALANAVQIADALKGFEVAFKRLCWQFYLHRGVLLDPSVALLDRD